MSQDILEHLKALHTSSTRDGYEKALPVWINLLAAQPSTILAKIALMEAQKAV